ncbi:hypothetical protein CPLU01_07523 [Colletotrichum plurivorum]|uniref:Uncharacterized protein n=1 Tax=Colletotrichum plurivorum TaxID=2175906 RepID=A0A8H6KFN4_9PEZI|nr:hypothetical protein CPLU01_07523 [Colletotrichum plurivorum]
MALRLVGGVRVFGPISARAFSALSTSDVLGCGLWFPGTSLFNPTLRYHPCCPGSACFSIPRPHHSWTSWRAGSGIELPMGSIGSSPSTPRPPVKRTGPRCAAGVNIAGSTASLIGDAIADSLSRPYA